MPKVSKVSGDLESPDSSPEAVDIPVGSGDSSPEAISPPEVHRLPVREQLMFQWPGWNWEKRESE